MPLLRRSRSRFKRPRFPRGAEWILLVDPKSGAEDGPYRVSDFSESQIEPGTWVCQTTAGHARFLRITMQEGNNIVSLDGAGEPWSYRIVAVPASEVSGG